MKSYCKVKVLHTIKQPFKNIVNKKIIRHNKQLVTHLRKLPIIQHIIDAFPYRVEPNHNLLYPHIPSCMWHEATGKRNISKLQN